MSKWHYMIILGLILVLAIILWKAPSSTLFELSERSPITQEQFPDSYSIKTKTTQYNEQGKVSHILLADKVSHYEASTANPQAYSLLVKPHFTFFDDSAANEAPWYISSQRGKSLNNGEEFLLSGNVLLIQKVDDNTIITTITSEELLIKPNEQYAETDKPVMIKDESGTTSSTGLKMSLEKETIELLSKVRSLYEPR